MIKVLVGLVVIKVPVGLGVVVVTIGVSVIDTEGVVVLLGVMVGVLVGVGEMVEQTQTSVLVVPSGHTISHLPSPSLYPDLHST